MFNKIKKVTNFFLKNTDKNFSNKEPEPIIRPKLYAPSDYWELTPKEKAEICNGCGSKDGLKVPGNFFGLDIKEACNIHDYMYWIGLNSYDKLFADAMFRMNLSVIIDSRTGLTGKFLSFFRHWQAGIYYTSVAKYGSKAFWVEKERLNPNHPKAFKITYSGEFRNLEDIENEEIQSIVSKLEKIQPGKIEN